MADTIELNPGSGGAVIATDQDVALAQHQYVKVEWGPDNTQTKVDTGASALPIQDGGNSITVDGTVAVTGVATAANQTTIIGHVDGIEGLLTTIDADTGTLAGAVAGSEMQVDVVSSALPSGAATAAKQPALGTAGTASADVITVQGVASMTPLLVNASGNAVPVTDNSSTLSIDDGGGNISIDDGGNTITVDGAVSVTNAGTFAVQASSVVPGTAATNLGKAEDAAHTTGDVGVMMLGVRNTSGATLADTTLDYSPVAVDEVGAVFVSPRTGGNGISGATVPRVTIANDSTGNIATIGTSITPGTSAAHLGKAEDAAHSSGDTGVMALGVRAASPTERSAGPTDGDYEPFATNEVGAVWISPTPSANGGLSIFRSLDLDESEEEVKSSAATVYGAWVTNTATTTRWLKFYNATAANTTVGTTTPVITIGIPGNTSDDISANFGPGGMGIKFDTALSVAATTGVADNDTGAPAANDVIVNIFYK